MIEIPIKTRNVTITKINCEIELDISDGNLFSPIRSSFDIDVNIPITPN